MAMSNFIDERERHAELYGTYTRRQKVILESVRPFTRVLIDDHRLMRQLHCLGFTDSEIGWLKRTGHVLPVLRGSAST